jgi:hypothetical protein
MNTIGWAVKQLQHGDQVRRAGWNGKGMALFLVKNWSDEGFADGQHPPTLPFVAMRTVQGGIVPWLCSQTDLLAADWESAE